MKRFLMVLALAGAMIGCGDDDDDDDSPDSGTDASVDAGGLDAAKPDSGTDAAVTVKVTNPGALCTAATTCMPSGATCATTTQFGIPSPGGGFCSASCTKAAECGDTGDCPLGEIVSGPSGSLVRDGLKTAGLGDVAAGQCYAKCTTPGTATGCQTGYVCSNLKQALFSTSPQADALGAVIQRGICIPAAGIVPRPPVGDGGVTDGGVRNDGGSSVADAGGIDSGT